MKKTVSLLIIAVTILIVFLMYYFGLFDRINLELLQEKAHILEEYVSHHWWWALLVFCGFFSLVTVLSIPITVLLTVASGYLFGITVGTCASVIGATIGGSIVFLLVRYFIGSWVQHRYSARLRTFNDEIKHYGAYYLLMLQLLPITPVFIINLFAGLSPLSLGTYIWATALGLLPGTLIYTVAGQKLHTINSIKDILSWQAMGVLLLLAACALTPMVIKRLIWPTLKGPN